MKTAICTFSKNCHSHKCSTSASLSKLMVSPENLRSMRWKLVDGKMYQLFSHYTKKSKLFRQKKCFKLSIQFSLKTKKTKVHFTFCYFKTTLVNLDGRKHFRKSFRQYSTTSSKLKVMNFYFWAKKYHFKLYIFIEMIELHFWKVARVFQQKFDLVISSLKLTDFLNLFFVIEHWLI